MGDEAVHPFVKREDEIQIGALVLILVAGWGTYGIWWGLRWVRAVCLGLLLAMVAWFNEYYLFDFPWEDETWSGALRLIVYHCHFYVGSLASQAIALLLVATPSGNSWFDRS